MVGVRISAGVAFVVLWLMTSVVVAQNPKYPTPTPGPPPIPNAATLWVDGQNLTVYVDSTVNPADRHMLTTLLIEWDGPGPGFVTENCDFVSVLNGNFDVCTAERIAKVKTRGFGPVYNLGDLIPKGFLAS